MRAVILKLPFKLREKWRTAACAVMERQRRRAQFIHVVNFIEYQVKIISDPIFGSIQHVEKRTPGKPKDVYKWKSPFQSKPNLKGDSFATNVTNVNKPVVGEIQRINAEHLSKQFNSNFTCLCYSQGHSLVQCKEFEKKKHREKVNFIKEKAVCFGCLQVGYMSKECKRCLTCKVCNQKHPSVLHIHEFKVDEAVNTNHEQNVEPTINNTCICPNVWSYWGRE